MSISCFSYWMREFYYNANRSLQPLTALKQQEIIMTDSYLSNPKLSDDSINSSVPNGSYNPGLGQM